MHPIYAAFVRPGHNPDEVAKGLRAVDPEHIRIMKVTPIQAEGIIAIITFQCPEKFFGRVLEVPGVDCVNDETDYETTTQFPTPAMDELFRISVAHFLEDKPSHRQVLIGCRLSLAGVDIDKWVQGQDLPADMPRRVHIMDWIWNHNCNCRCA